MRYFQFILNYLLETFTHKALPYNLCNIIILYKAYASCYWWRMSKWGFNIGRKFSSAESFTRYRWYVQYCQAIKLANSVSFILLWPSRALAWFSQQLHVRCIEGLVKVSLHNNTTNHSYPTFYLHVISIMALFYAENTNSSVAIFILCECSLDSRKWDPSYSPATQKAMRSQGTSD
jgi:hypothetical protein